MRRRALPLIGLVGALGCAQGGGPATPPPPSSAQPAGWDREVTVASPMDVNPDPKIVELTLDARVNSVELRPGSRTDAWTYDGTVPGPLIRAHVGDRLIVHFTNHLPEESTVHWHGIRLPADMDGVPGHTQAPVAPGGTFDYSFVLPDEGLFWYHPHVRSAAQAGDGLYGALLVEPAETPAELPADLQDQAVLVLSDIALNADGSLADPNSDSGGDFGTLFGRTGEVLLVNGKVRPTIKAIPGLRQRWRIVNSAKTRYYQLAIAGHKFTQIGVDGGYLETPREVDKLLVIPGGRADVIVTPTGTPGTELSVRWVPYDRGYGATFMIPEEDLFHVALVEGTAPAQAPLPARLRTIAPIDTAQATARGVNLTQDLSTGQLILGINGVPSWDAKAFEAHTGDTEVWTLSNDMDFDHPFHLHGFFFQPLDPKTGAAPASPEWLDTYNVPKHDSVQIAVKYDDRAGMWMFHCHILDHADAGMMGMLMLRR